MRRKVTNSGRLPGERTQAGAPPVWRRWPAVALAGLAFAWTLAFAGAAQASFSYGLQFGGSGAGNGQFSAPSGVAVDPSTGNVYVVDAGNNRVEKFDSSGNYLSQFGSSGTGNGQLSGPSGVAVDPSTGNVYVVDAGNNRVEKFNSSGTYLAQFGNTTVNAPTGIAVDPSSGSVYVADTGNNAVDKFSSSGSLQSQFTSSGAPSGVAVAPSTGNVYVVDRSRNRVQVFDSSGTLQFQFGSSGSGNGQFNAPAWVAVDPLTGNVYVTDRNNNRVEKFDAAGNYRSQFGTSGSGNGQFNSPSGVAVDPATANVYVADTGNNRVEKFTGAIGGFHGYLGQFGSHGSGNGQLSNPYYAAVDPTNGSLYVADSFNNRIEKFDSSGNYSSQFGTAGSGNGQFSTPMGVAVDSLTGNVYVTDRNNNRVEIFDSTGSYMSQFGSSGSGNGQLSAPLGVAIDPSTGDVYVVDHNNNRVEVFDATGNFLFQFGSAQLVAPYGIAVDPATGNVYVSDPGSNQIDEFNSTGSLLTQFGSAGSGNGQFNGNGPAGVAVDASTGDVYASDPGNSRVQKFDSSGNFLSQFGSAGSGNGQFSGPTGLAIDPSNGSVYVTDRSNSRVQKFGKLPPSNTSLPVISGTMQDGRLVSASTGTWSSPDTLTFVYQWQRCDGSGNGCVNIAGQTSSTYMLTQADVGHRITVVVTATDQQNQSGSATASPVGPVASPPPPSNQTLPAISGTAQDGQQLSTSNGGWSSPDTLSYSYQWQRCDGSGNNCVNIIGATQSSYTLAPADVGRKITVIVTATDQENQSTNATATPAGPVASPPAPANHGLPAISGTAQDGQLLSASTGTWSSPDTLTFAYQWQRCDGSGNNCVNITGQTSPSYKLAPADVGHMITVAVTATDQENQSMSASATAVGPVAKPPAPHNTSVPVVSGTPTKGQTLKTTNGTWSSPDTLTFKYQWERCSATGAGCLPIPGATLGSYKLLSSDVGHKITVVVTATDQEAQSAHVAAKPVGPIVP